MKKLIAILAVLAIVAGSVFAAATIKVQSKVGGPAVDPAFVLRASLTGEDTYSIAIAEEGEEACFEYIRTKILYMRPGTQLAEYLAHRKE